MLQTFAFKFQCFFGWNLSASVLKGIWQQSVVCVVCCVLACRFVRSNVRSFACLNAYLSTYPAVQTLKRPQDVFICYMLLPLMVILAVAVAGADDDDCSSSSSSVFVRTYMHAAYKAMTTYLHIMRQMFKSNDGSWLCLRATTSNSTIQCTTMYITSFFVAARSSKLKLWAVCSYIFECRLLINWLLLMSSIKI